MSMSMNVIGIPKRDYFDKMIEIKEKCEELGVDIPKEVKEFFGDYWEESRSCLENEVLHVEVPHREWHDDAQEGFEIDVKSIPSNIETIRFYCSW